MDELSTHVRPFHPSARPFVRRESPVKWKQFVPRGYSPPPHPLEKYMRRKGRSMRNDKNPVPPRRDGESDVARNSIEVSAIYIGIFPRHTRKNIFF